MTLTLKEAITATQTTIDVNGSDTLRVGSYRQLADEVILIRAADPRTLQPGETAWQRLTVDRGIENSEPAVHAAGVTMAAYAGGGGGAIAVTGTEGGEVAAASALSLTGTVIDEGGGVAGYAPAVLTGAAASVTVNLETPDVAIVAELGDDSANADFNADPATVLLEVTAVTHKRADIDLGVDDTHFRRWDASDVLTTDFDLDDTRAQLRHFGTADASSLVLKGDDSTNLTFGTTAQVYLDAAEVALRFGSFVLTLDAAGVHIGTETGPTIRTGTADPSAGAGVAAGEGSLYLRTTATAGQTWAKTGAADTAWTKLTP